MQRILNNHDRVIVHLLKSQLEDEGICCVIKNDLPSLNTEFPVTVEQPELWILNDRHYLAASSMVRKLMDHDFIKKDWCCHYCREKIERQFDVCWQCGGSR